MALCEISFIKIFRKVNLVAPEGKYEQQKKKEIKPENIREKKKKRCQ